MEEREEGAKFEGLFVKQSVVEAGFDVIGISAGQEYRLFNAAEKEEAMDRGEQIAKSLGSVFHYETDPRMEVEGEDSIESGQMQDEPMPEDDLVDDQAGEDTPEEEEPTQEDLENKAFKDDALPESVDAEEPKDTDNPDDIEGKIQESSDDKLIDSIFKDVGKEPVVEAKKPVKEYTEAGESKNTKKNNRSFMAKPKIVEGRLPKKEEMVPSSKISEALAKKKAIKESQENFDKYLEKAMEALQSVKKDVLADLKAKNPEVQNRDIEKEAMSVLIDICPAAKAKFEELRGEV